MTDKPIEVRYSMVMKLLWIIPILTFFVSCSDIKSVNESQLSEKNPPTIAALEKQVSSVELKEEATKELALVEVETLTFKNSEKVLNYCKKIDQYFEKYGWKNSDCDQFSWNHVRNSYLGNPIIWHTIGDEKKHEKSPLNTTLIFCGVHGDEITPIKFCFDILRDLKKNPEVVKDKLVIIAPIVTPDSFFKKYPSRTNARGIDVNRNFPTKDWKNNAVKLWKSRYKADKRRYPGKKPFSEQETIFQVNLIKRYNPNKIISVHAPLTLLDYDGPESDHKHASFGKELLIQMSNKAGKYRINNYPFFTGSLGNWAGNERGIPTYTLELPNSDWTKTKKFFNTFRLAIHHAIDHELKPEHITTKKVTENESETTDNETFL